MEHTFVMVKPDGVRRGLVGEVIGRFENEGLRLERMRMLTIDEDLAGRHYAEHTDKSFFADLVSFITSGPVVAIEWSGPDAVSVVRSLMGPTDPGEALSGTIRGDFGTVITENIVHGSDSLDSAEREIRLFFA
ncbi:MAG: nucleoside-diphosphate kinase [Acidimicrobiia bacterium]